MIYGIGTDIVEIGRISELIERFGDRFAGRILSEEEWAGYRTNPSPAHFLAKRFAAKEAFSKAAGTGLRYPVSCGMISIVNDGLGKPGFRFREELNAFMKACGISSHHLSISDEKSVACAFVVLER